MAGARVVPSGGVGIEDAGAWIQAGALAVSLGGPLLGDAFMNGKRYHQPAVPIDPMDTVGAGDAFVAGYLTELIAGKGSAKRLELATKTDAFACLAYGDWEGLLRRAELALLDQGDSVTR